MDPRERAVESVVREISAGIKKLRREREEEPGKLRSMGKYWRDARLGLERDLYDTADALGITPSELNVRELGGSIDLWRGSFPIDYSGILEQPELYPAFCELFGIKPFNPNSSET